jgi:hypothetical protein
MSRTPWFVAPLGSAEYRVSLADPDDSLLAQEDAADGPAEGAVCHETGVIVIRRDLPRKRIPEVCLHELLHAVFHISGLSVTMRWKLATEERVVHNIAPFMAHALVGGGLWKFPRVPK